MNKRVLSFVLCMVLVGITSSVSVADVLYQEDFSSETSLDMWLPAGGTMSIVDGWFQMYTEQSQHIAYKQSLSGSIALEADVKMERIDANKRPAFGLQVYKRAPAHTHIDTGYLVILNTANPARDGDKLILTIFKPQPDTAHGIKAVADAQITDISYEAGGSSEPIRLRVEIYVDDVVRLKVFTNGELLVDVVDDDEEMPLYTRGYIAVWKQTDAIVKWDNFTITRL